jgi:hypothetical protein
MSVFLTPLSKYFCANSWNLFKKNSTLAGKGGCTDHLASEVVEVEFYPNATQQQDGLSLPRP